MQGIKDLVIDESSSISWDTLTELVDMIPDTSSATFFMTKRVWNGYWHLKLKFMLGELACRL